MNSCTEKARILAAQSRYSMYILILTLFAVLPTNSSSSWTLWQPEDPQHMHINNFLYCKADRDFCSHYNQVVRDFHSFWKSRCHSQLKAGHTALSSPYLSPAKCPWTVPIPVVTRTVVRSASKQSILERHGVSGPCIILFEPRTFQQKSLRQHLMWQEEMVLILCQVPSFSKQV